METKYRVVSDRRSYGLYDNYEDAYQRMCDLCQMASYMYSDEYFWIEEE